MSQVFRPDGLPQPSDPFEVAVTDFIVDLFEALPTWGTATGYHRVDGRWHDPSEAGREARLAMYARHRARLEAFDEAELDREACVDRRILLEEIEKAEFGDAVLRSEAWDPLEAVYVMGSGLFGLLSREYAPWSERGAAVLQRIEGLPQLVRASLAALTGLDDRPVALLQLDTALAQLGGVSELVDAAVSEAQARAARDDAPELVEPMLAAAADARTAIETFRGALDTEVRARAAGDGRLGGELFAQKLRLTLGSDISPDELRARAWRDFHAVRAEMLRLARETWSHWFPGEPLPEVAAGDTGGEAALVRRVLDAIAGEHQQPADLISFCEAEMGRIEAFCRDHDVISLPEEPMTITPTPVFMLSLIHI